MIELMRQVACADGHLADHERHVLWRIADLLHVRQGDSIGAMGSTESPERAATACRRPGVPAAGKGEKSRPSGPGRAKAWAACAAKAIC